MTARTAKRATSCDAGAARRGTAPAALGAEARSVRLRVEHVCDATRTGEEIAVEDIDAITATLVDLQWRIERSVPERHDAGGVDALFGARQDIGASAEAVCDLVAWFATV